MVSPNYFQGNKLHEHSARERERNGIWEYGNTDREMCEMEGKDLTVPFEPTTRKPSSRIFATLLRTSLRWPGIHSKYRSWNSTTT